MKNGDVMKDLLFGEAKKLIKFGITGVMNTLVDFVVFMLLTHVGLNLYISQVISYGCGMLNSYIVNRSWTFEAKERFFGGQMVRFASANLTLLAVSVGLMWVFTVRMDFIKIVAKLFTTAIIMLAGFTVNRLWVFKNR